MEILVNEPYTEGPGGAGQYTHKIFHVGSHLPGESSWVESIRYWSSPFLALPGWLKALLPKSAFIVEEKAWNAYPYTRTRYTCPFVEKFSLDIETVYREDCGDIDNVFKLSNSELNERAVGMFFGVCRHHWNVSIFFDYADLIDVVKDQLPTASDYVKEEDPCVFISRKTGRGPLSETWIQDYWRECKVIRLEMIESNVVDI